MIRWNQHESDVISIQDSVPLRFDFRNLRISFQELLTVKIASSIHEHFASPCKAVDEVTSPLILREHASSQVMVLDKVGCANGKCGGIEADASHAGERGQARSEEHTSE